MDERTGMESATHVKRLTSDEFFAMFPDEDHVRRELIAGKVVVMPAPTTRHQDLVKRLAVALENHLAVHADQGTLYVSPLDVVITRHDVVEPDLLVVLAHQAHIVTDKNIQGAPALTVEILSPGTRKRDLTVKHRLYRRSGVHEYWMVDPDSSTVTIYRRTGEGFFRLGGTLTAAGGHVLETPLLPGWRLELTRLFR